MRFANKLTVLVLASIPFACGDDSAPIGDDSSSTGDNEDSSDDDPSTVTITTVDPDSSSSSGDATTVTTVDPDTTGSTTDDPTDTTESSSSTDPTKGEDSSSSTTDPTDASSSSTGGTDPTDASSSESGGSESSTGEVIGCADEDLGSAVPVTVDLDTTMGDSTFEGSCSFGAGSPDYAYQWTAPADGSYIFTTSRPETAFDTILYLLDTDCDGAELTCDDEGGEVGNTSLVTRDMAMGDTVIIVVDGWQAASSGVAQLYIDVLPTPADGGSCCDEQDGVGGCDSVAFETCVCNFDSECCTVEWDSTCASEAVDVCGADCGPPASCVEEDFCNAPGDDCSCFGCIDDGVCADGEDDCTCADCEGEAFCGCNDDGICDPYVEACTCADCSDEDVCSGVVPPSGCSEDPDNGCAEPLDDCSCFACVDDGSCDIEEDCICGDCTDEVFCGGGACSDDGVCDVYNEGCSCDDCADEVVCAAPVGESQQLTAGPGLAVAVADDAYLGTLATMACVTLPLAANGIDTVAGGQLVLGMSHTWIGDLTIKVVSPVGTAVTVLSRPGFAEVMDNGAAAPGDSSNLAFAFPLTYVNGGTTDAEVMGSTLDSSGVVCQNDSLCVYDPNPGAAVAGDFSAFAGESAVGNWRVCVGDSAGGDLGVIDAVTLTIDQN